MTKPVYKIETYTGAVKDHTIKKDALSVYFKEIVTDGVGYFSFTVPTKKNGSSYYYDDIALNDKVKIWMGYDSISGDPNFIGKVGEISAPLSTQSGYLRLISGLSQGEVLLRRFKKDKYYNGIGASTIVTEWATDLGLGTGDITADATAVTLEVKTKTYFDLLRWISDYWYSAESQIKKDFYVDVDNDLVWKDRPFRTAGVETLTVGDNIVSYRVTRDVEAVKNNATVYGAAEKTLPTGKDDWTDSLTDWSASDGELSLYSNGQKLGSYSIRCHTGAADNSYCFKRDIPRVTIRDITTLYFWRYNATQCSTSNVRLLAPDTSNYFEAGLGTANDWSFKELPLGPNHIYDANENPNGTWTETGSPNWWDIKYIQFEGTYSINDRYAHVDGIYFYPERWEAALANSPSATAYGVRDLEVTDDKLHSYNDCLKRVYGLLEQMKDPPVQIDVSTPGNMNILVGDRLSMTIPAEGISSANYDVISVEQGFTRQTGFITKATMVNSANIREPVAKTPIRLLTTLRRHFRELSIDEKLIR